MEDLKIKFGTYKGKEITEMSLLECQLALVTMGKMYSNLLERNLNKENIKENKMTEAFLTFIVVVVSLVFVIYIQFKNNDR